LILRKLIVRRSHQLLLEVFKILNVVHLLEFLLRERHRLLLDLMRIGLSVRKLTPRTSRCRHLELTIELVIVGLIRLLFRILTITKITVSILPMLRLIVPIFITVAVTSVVSIRVWLVRLIGLLVTPSFPSVTVFDSTDQLSSLLVLGVVRVSHSNSFATAGKSELAC